MPSPVGSTLAAAQHAHRAKADRFIGAYRSRIGARWIDRHAMMPTLVEKPSCRQPQRNAPQSLILIPGRKKDIEARVTVVGVGLLVVSKPPGQIAVDFDCKRRAVVAQAVAGVPDVFLWTPPLAHPRSRKDLHKSRQIALFQGPQCHAPSAQARRHHASVPPTLRCDSGG